TLWVASVRHNTRLGLRRIWLFPVTSTQVIVQIPQVKMRLPEPDINGCFDRCDDLCFRKGYPERAEQRADHGAVTRRLHAMRSQQARRRMLLPHYRALLSCGSGHHTPPSSPHVSTIAGGPAPLQRCSSHAPLGATDPASTSPLL